MLKKVYCLTWTENKSFLNLGNVDVLTTYCNECSLVSISSSGPAGDLYPGSFGRYKNYIEVETWPLNCWNPTSYATYGSLWENMIPIFKNPSSSHFLTVHPQANPEFYYVPWVLTDRFATDPEDLSHLTVKSQVSHFILSIYVYVLCISIFNIIKLQATSNVTCLPLFCTYFSMWNLIARTERALCVRGTRLGHWCGNTRLKMVVGTWITLLL